MSKLLFSFPFFLAGTAVGAAAHGDLGLTPPRQLNQTVSPGCQQACIQLSDAFGPFLHYPDGDNFTVWDAQQQEVRPACRVQPSNAADVSRVLGILVDNWCRFAVKGGGHGRSPDDSNSVGGVTVDLARISTVKIAADGTTARVGGGTNSIQAYGALETRNLSFVGGRVATVGVGGFTLGGGTSPFSNKYGWALDNVYEYEIVLANGTITNVSEDRNPDLYFALRGGANNFGIVTTFTVRTFPQGPVFNSVATYGQNQTEEVLDRVYDLLFDSELTGDVNMGYEMAYSYSQSADSFTLSGTQRYEQPIMDPPVFQAIDQIPPATRTSRIVTMSTLLSGPESLGTTRYLFGTVSILPSRAMLTQGLEIFRQEVEAIKTVEGLAPNLICYALQRNAIAAMKQRGGNALGIDQDDPLFIILISTGCSNAQGDSAVASMTTNTLARIKSASQSLGVSHPYLYINYAMGGQADEVFAGYGEANARRLREIQRAVDPTGVFTAEGLWRGFMKLN